MYKSGVKMVGHQFRLERGNLFSGEFMVFKAFLKTIDDFNLNCNCQKPSPGILLLSNSANVEKKLKSVFNFNFFGDKRLDTS